MSTEVSTPASDVRHYADYHPSLWENHFLTCASDMTIDSTTQEQREVLKEEVRKMITATTSRKGVLQLIDAIQRLGVAYHFDKDIEDELVKIFHNVVDGDEDLCTVSLRFRLLRQQGIKISCDVFNKFKDEESKYFFKESLIKDVEGMLSLYEAAYFGIQGEEILDEAVVFAATHLKSMVPLVCPKLAEQINHALICPLRKAVPRLEARYYFDIYARDDSHNQTLLKFAKLDFNILQAQHQQELSALIRWWRELIVSFKAKYIRDRIVECYFWIMGVHFEPKYAFGRNFLTKIICMASIMDDTYDAYGTYEELKLLTEAVKRWEIGAIHTLPEYMKIIYKTLLDVYNEIEEKLAKEGRSHCIPYAKEKMQELIDAYFTQAKWLHKGYFPTVEEYKSVALRSSGLLMLTTNSFLGMGDLATEDAFKWIFTNPKIVMAAAVIGRIMNDIVGHENEQKRGHIPSAVECYMKQYGVSEEQAVKLLNQEVENAWKDTNEELLINPNAIPFPLLERILNFSRTCNLIYTGGDCYTNSYLMKDQVASQLKDPAVF